MVFGRISGATPGLNVGGAGGISMGPAGIQMGGLGTSPGVGGGLGGGPQGFGGPGGFGGGGLGGGMSGLAGGGLGGAIAAGQIRQQAQGAAAKAGADAYSGNVYTQLTQAGAPPEEAASQALVAGAQKYGTSLAQQGIVNSPQEAVEAGAQYATQTGTELGLVQDPNQLASITQQVGAGIAQSVGANNPQDLAAAGSLATTSALTSAGLDPQTTLETVANAGAEFGMQLDPSGQSVDQFTSLSADTAANFLSEAAAQGQGQGQGLGVPSAGLGLQNAYI